MKEKEKHLLFKQFNDELIDLCKEGGNLARIGYLLDSGADISYGHSKPMYWAAKRRDFPLLELLIDKGALSDKNAIRHIASICEHSGFKGKTIENFFRIIDKARAITGDDFNYFIPYINSMVTHGKIDAVFELMERYNLSEREISAVIFPGAIYEAIKNGHNTSLDFINDTMDWMTATMLDSAVSTGETDVVKYLYDNSDLGLPSEPAILRAIFDGSTDILDLLIERGLDIKNRPEYLNKACLSFYSNGAKSLEYLLRRGYTLNDTYNGKTIYQNAVSERNTPLIKYLEDKK